MKNLYLAMVVCALGLGGCTSVIDSKKISGLQQLGTWKEQATAFKDEKKGNAALYKRAKAEIDTYISVTLDSQIDDVASNVFGGRVDLTSEAIPLSVKTAAEKYFDSVEVYGSPAIPAALTAQLGTWALVEAEGWVAGKREKSAEKLKEKLNTLKWEPWN